MPAGTLFGAIQAFQQSSDWMGKLRQEQEKHRAIAALGRAYSQPDAAPQAGPQMPPAGTGMGPAQAMQGAQDAQQAGPGGPAAPNAVPNSPSGPGGIPPNVLASLQAMRQQKGGQQQPQQQGPQLAQQGAPSMAQPSPLQQQPHPNLSSTAQPDAAGMQDLNAQASQTLKSIGQSLKMATPNIDPYTLALAVQMQVENIKGLAPLTKAYAQGQIQAVIAQQKAQQFTIKLTQAGMMFDQRMSEIHRRNLSVEEEKKASDQALADFREATIDKDYAQIAAGEKNTEVRADASIKNTDSRNKTSRDNNKDTNAREDKTSDRASASRRAASEAQVYSQARNTFLRKHPNDAKGAQAFARQAVNDVQAGTPRASSGGAPAPNGGANYAAQGGKQARDGHWYVANNGSDKKTHPYLRLDD